jgi:hypothetical protein
VPVYWPDARQMRDGRVRIVWAHTEAEAPNDRRHIDISLDEPRIDLLALFDQPPPDEPEEPEEPTVQIPDHFHIVRAVNAAHPQLLAINSPDTIREFYWRAADALHQHDPRWGMLSKSGGEQGHEIEGAGRVAHDAVAYKDVTPIVDIIAGAGGIGVASAVWQVVEQRRESNKWVKPPRYIDNDHQEPEEPKEPEQPAENWRDEARRLAELIRLGEVERLALAGRLQHLETEHRENVATMAEVADAIEDLAAKLERPLKGKVAVDLPCVTQFRPRPQLRAVGNVDLTLSFTPQE